MEIVNKKAKTEIKYACSWCGYKFKRWVGSPEGVGIRKVGPQIQCQMCHMFIPTKEKRAGWKRARDRRG